jgi:hypothetical protein
MNRRQFLIRSGVLVGAGLCHSDTSSAQEDRPRLFLKSPSSARERAVLSPDKDGEAGDIERIVDTAPDVHRDSQVEKGPLEARSTFQTEPNILVIMTDQQAATAMSCTGNPHLKTPAMDSIAAGGIRFERAYVTQPLCLPCRSSMLTGRYPHEIGTVTNGTKYNRDWPMLGKLMANGGYECAYIGKWHVGALADYEHAG